MHLERSINCLQLMLNQVKLFVNDCRAGRGSSFNKKSSF